MSRMLILFLHGWQSTPSGVKLTYLKDHGHEVLNPKLPDDDFDAACQIAQAEFDQHTLDVIVGSSRGIRLYLSVCPLQFSQQCRLHEPGGIERRGYAA
jgi:hypothetical protein